MPPYEDTYCARGPAENLINMYKGQLASNWTSCQSPLANQLKLVLYTAAYWLMLALPGAIPRTAPFARAESTTLRLRLIEIGARVVEKASRVLIPLHLGLPRRHSLPPARRPSRRSRTLSNEEARPGHPALLHPQPRIDEPHLTPPNGVRSRRDPSNKVQMPDSLVNRSG